MKYTFDMFKNPNEAWVVVRLDMLGQVRDNPFDMYVMLDAYSAYAFGSIIVLGECPKPEEVLDLFDRAFLSKKEHAQKILFPKGDPAEEFFYNEAKKRNIAFEVVPKSDLEAFAEPIIDVISEFMEKKSFSCDDRVKPEENPEVQKRMMRDFVPDSYDPCSCGSRKKFKFCCKPIYREIIDAMAYAQNGSYEDALEAMRKAEKVIGRTAEVLCRYSIVYHYFDVKKSNKYLDECFKKFPNHPRANYLKGILLKEERRFEEAIEAYKRAIANYPKTDKYHLNETWNNLGTVYYESGNFFEAKAAWEQALIYIPYDRVVRENLRGFIYNDSNVPESLRSMSPFIRRIYESEESIDA